MNERLVLAVLPIRLGLVAVFEDCKHACWLCSGPAQQARMHAAADVLAAVRYMVLVSGAGVPAVITIILVSEIV